MDEEVKRKQCAIQQETKKSVPEKCGKNWEIKRVRDIMAIICLTGLIMIRLKLDAERDEVLVEVNISQRGCNEWYELGLGHRNEGQTEREVTRRRGDERGQKWECSSFPQKTPLLYAKGRFSFFTSLKIKLLPYFICLVFSGCVAKEKKRVTMRPHLTSDIHPLVYIFIFMLFVTQQVHLHLTHSAVMCA